MNKLYKVYTATPRHVVAETEEEAIEIAKAYRLWRTKKPRAVKDMTYEYYTKDGVVDLSRQHEELIPLLKTGAKGVVVMAMSQYSRNWKVMPNASSSFVWKR